MQNFGVKESNIRGLGVFALKDFKPGEHILDRDLSDVITDKSKLSKHDWEYELDFLENGKIVRLKTPDRYFNHSCDPNAYVKTVNRISRVFAMREIKKGEEITFDYSINGNDNGTFECRCGSKNCRKIYQGNFFKLPRDIQIKYLPYLEDWFKKEHRKEIVEIEKVFCV